MTETMFIRDARANKLLGVGDLPREARILGTILRGRWNSTSFEEDYIVVDVGEKTVYVNSLRGEKE